MQVGETYLNKALQLFNDGEAFSTHIALVGRKHTARLQAGVTRRRRRRRRLMVEETFDVM